MARSAVLEGVEIGKVCDTQLVPLADPVPSVGKDSCWKDKPRTNIEPEKKTAIFIVPCSMFQASVETAGWRHDPSVNTEHKLQPVAVSKPIPCTCMNQALKSEMHHHRNKCNMFPLKMGSLP